MNLREEYFIKANTRKLKELAKECLSNKDVLEEVKLYAFSKYKFNKYACWTLSYVVQFSKQKGKELVVEFLSNLNKCDEKDFIGTALYVFSLADFDLEENAHVLDYSLEILHDRKGQPYFKYYALKVIAKFCEYEPDLVKEVLPILIEVQDSINSKSGQKECLKLIKKLK